MVVTFLSTILLAAAPPGTQPTAEYLSDVRYRMVHMQQGWGQLGLNTCAFERGAKRIPLRIGEKEYSKGLGHHAPGEIIVDLGGDYQQFEAEVGLQPLEGGTGSAVFQVFVDDQQKFDSGVIREADPPKLVSVPISGAMELRLVVTNAGDGIVNDCANWADAKLIRSADAPLDRKSAGMDVAPFAELLMSDPNRKDGASAKRIEEFRAEDVFLESTFQSDEGRYPVGGPRGSDALGLNWLQRRTLRSIGIEFLKERPARDVLQAECWVGQSLWQGDWKPLDGQWRETPGGWELLIDWFKIPDARNGTRKIRWLFPKSEKGWDVKPGGLTAISTTPFMTADLRFEWSNASATKMTVGVSDGRFIDQNHERLVEWDAQHPLTVQLEYAKPRPSLCDRTVLHFNMKNSPIAVAVDEVLNKGSVYVRDAGLFVTKKDGPSLAEYKKQIEGKKTILQEIRALPDQTFAQAIDKVHNPKQDLQPMLLSLACDNRKFAVQRDGTIQFSKEDDKADQFAGRPLKYPAQMTPKFGSGKNPKFRRHLDGGWMPAPVTEIEDEGVIYTQRTYVIPSLSEKSDSSNPWLDPRPLCVIEFSAKPVDPAKASAGSIELTFHGDVEKHDIAEVSNFNFDIRHNGQWLGRVPVMDASMSIHAGNGMFQIGWSSTSWGRVFRIYLFGFQINPDDDAPVPVSEPFQVFQQYWTRVMAPVMQAELPDPLLTNVIRASQVHCLLAARNEENGERIAPWIASFVYGPLESESNSIVRGMDAWGHHEFARRSLNFFINKYNPAGFLTTGYTLMGTGWHLWTLGEHYQLTRDDAWMKSVADKVVKVCQWIGEQRQKTMRKMGDRPSGNREYGLMPPGVLADWNAYAYYFCLNGYYYKGLLEAARGLAAIKYNGANELLKDADAFRDDILRAYHHTQAQMPVYPLRDGTSVPGYPSQLTAPGPSNNFFPGEDGNRSWCYDVELGAHQLVPQGVLDPKSPEVADMMDHMEDVQFLAEGWFDYPAERNQKDPYNQGGFSKVQPYYCRNIEIDALRDDVKPFIRSYFNTIPSLLGLETLSFQEHFNGVAAWNKTHETGYFLYYSRLMLVQERDDDLWLAPFVTSNWLKDGAEIKVKNAPTRFGPVGYRIKSAIANNQIEADIEPPTRQPPKRIVLRLRHPEGKTATIQKVTGVNSDSITIEKEQIGQEKSHCVVITPPENPTPIHIVIGYQN